MVASSNSARLQEALGIAAPGGLAGL